MPLRGADLGTSPGTSLEGQPEHGGGCMDHVEAQHRDTVFVQQEAGAEDDEEHSADEAAGQQASDAAQQLDDLAQHQHGAARYMAHAAQDPFAGQPADSQVWLVHPVSIGTVHVGSRQ